MRHRHDRVRQGRAFRSICVVAVAPRRQTYDDAKEIMRLWVERFVARLDIIQGRSGR